MIAVNVYPQIAGLLRVQREVERQVPFGVARGLTATARDAAAELTRRLEVVFDRPTPFTKRAIGTKGATKANLVARVFVKDAQAGYLDVQVTGGQRVPKRRALVLPGKALRVNQYGNIPRGKIQALLARDDVFSGVVDGQAGIWQRRRRGPPKLMVAYVKRARYRKRWPFYETAAEVTAAKVVGNVAEGLRYAIATAR